MAEIQRKLTWLPTLMANAPRETSPWSPRTRSVNDSFSVSTFTWQIFLS
jgi:hypothetical protein